MEYEIVIKKKLRVEYTAKNWVKLFDYTEAEQKMPSWDHDTRPDQYGYAETDSIRTEETEILKQTVTDLDMAAVIKAINGL